ncbi:ribonuclease H-like domain-containing protein, partial [Mycena rosella]
CKNDSDVTTATQALQGQPTLFLDCEGDRLGLKGGRLSLISIGIHSQDDNEPLVYLIDALALETAALRPIFNLLESSNVRKVVFDARMDQSALFHDHGRVEMQNLVDLQLADIKSRARRGEDAQSVEQLARLTPYLPPNEVNSHAPLYGVVQKLSRLTQAVEEHQVDVAHTQMTLKARFDHTKWAKRPLPRSYLKYAANDIALIAHLWAKFMDEGYIDGALPEQSLRYARMWTVGAQPYPEDVYKLHGLLPLNILENIQADQVKLCSGCERSLPQDCFSNSAWNLGVNRKCLVCRAIGIRLAIRRK